MAKRAKQHIRDKNLNGYALCGRWVGPEQDSPALRDACKRCWAKFDRMELERAASPLTALRRLVDAADEAEDREPGMVGHDEAREEFLAALAEAKRTLEKWKR